MVSSNYAVSNISFQHHQPNKDLMQEIVSKASFTLTPPKIHKVMGEVIFPAAAEDRPYTFGCMVLSGDGKMAFPDNQEGHLISHENRFDPTGALTDFWIMNVCRTYADAVILGCNTLQIRMHKKWFAEVRDPELIEARRNLLQKKTDHPWSIIASADGTDVPLEHVILDMKPAVGILTSLSGAEYLAKNLKRKCALVAAGEPLNAGHDYIKIVAAGEETVDTKQALRILRQGGLNYLSIEAPGYIWHLMQEKMLDEFFLNYSGVYVGGEFTLGRNVAFSTGHHPHGALLMLGYHRGFIYTRQKLIYD